MQGGGYISSLVNKHQLVRAQTYIHTKPHELCRQTTNKRWHRCMVYTGDIKNMSPKKIMMCRVQCVYIEGIQIFTDTTVKHTLRLHSLRGAAHPDKTGRLRAIYRHLMHSEPPVSGCVGREMRCGVFPIRLNVNTLTITSSTSSEHLHSAALWSAWETRTETKDNRF